MEHCGMEFSVIRTIPKGWAWSVKRSNRDRVATAYDREEVIKKAKLFIENHLRSLRRAEDS